MEMKLILSSSTHKSPCFQSWRSLQQAIDKPLVFKPFRNFVCFDNFGQRQAPNSDVGRVRISRSLMPGPVQEFFKGNKHSQDTSSRFKLVRTLLIDNYDSYTYNIYQELSTINGVPPTVIHNDEWKWEHFYHYLYEENAFDNIVISPGPGSPTCPTDIGLCLRILLECKDIPILGVCLGHQALGYAHGANIIHAPTPVHGRLSEIQHNGSYLFDGIPSGHQSGFKAVRYHSLVIDADSLPEELIPIAWTSSMDNHSSFDTLESDVVPGHLRDDVYQSSVGNLFINEKCLRSKYSKKAVQRSLIMAIMHSTRPHFGVQFHPESVATCYGRKLFENFKEITVDYWQKSSHFHERKVHNWARMQVSRSSQLFEKFVEPLSCKAQATYPAVGPVVNSSRRIVQMTRKYLKLRWKKIDSLANTVGGSRNIFCKLFGDQKAKDTFWLDSSSTDQKRARFSFMGGKGGSLWRQITFRLTTESGGYLSIEDAQGSVDSVFLQDGFLDFLSKELQSFHYSKEDYKGLPFDFCGGYVGFIGYDLKVECGATYNHHKSGTPDACFFFADNLVVVDHSNGDVYLLSLEGNCYPNNMQATSAETLNGLPWLDKAEKKLLELKATEIEKYLRQNAKSAIGTRSEEGFVSQKSREQYLKDVEKCLEFIKDGESYELCLTTQMRKRSHDTNLLGLYLNLRDKNPAPYAAWLNFAKENLCICSSSPERFLRLDGHGILEAKPIKGTIARGATKVEDEQLRLQLLHSVKDQAENLMIVDLLRNDLGRVCEPGSVHVPRLMDVESYATVHTMVSTIQGKKKLNLSPIDCVRAAFPGGSMTGAPKLRSMELLDSLEDCSRGVYSGSIGFFSYNQTFDLNIVIRTIVIHNGEASIGAGGAIIALSNPEDEYEEMKLKARTPAKAFMEMQGLSSSFD